MAINEALKNIKVNVISFSFPLPSYHQPQTGKGSLPTLRYAVCGQLHLDRSRLPDDADATGKEEDGLDPSLNLPSTKDMKKVISSPWEAVKVANKLVKDRYKEYAIGLYLDTRNGLIKSEIIGIGTLNACLVHPREVFYPAVKRRCATMIFMHNHPAGNVEPSEDDKETTKRLRSAGKLLGIDLTDSIIFEKGGAWYSLRDKEGDWD